MRVAGQKLSTRSSRSQPLALGTFQVLTKRPERMLAYARRVEASKPHDTVNMAVFDLARISGDFANSRCQNVWLGVSVGDQGTAAARIPCC